MYNFFKIAELAISEYIPMASVLVLGGIFSIKTKFFQIKNLKKSLISTFGLETKGKSGINSFQAVCTTLASTIGTGNIVGVATAISIGGPGAVLWMVLSAFLCMIIKMFEITLAVKFKEKNNIKCGPLSYIKSVGKKTEILVFLFCLFSVFSSFTSGNITQINTVSVAISENFFAKLLVGFIIAILVFCVVCGGVKRIAKFSEIAVPFMSVIYIVLCLGIIIINTKKLPETFYKIIVGAFNPRAVTGGAVGSISIVAGIGVSRGIFSNEAGLGTAAFAHIHCNNSDAAGEGICGIFEVFFDTVVMCALTGVAIISAGIKINYGQIISSKLIIDVFKVVYGDFAELLIAIMLLFFGFTSVVGWGYFGLECVEYRFPKFKRLYILIYPIFCILGAICSVSMAWRLAALFNGLMLCINMYCVLLHFKTAIKEVKNYEN